jgi:hypothetical protein
MSALGGSHGRRSRQSEECGRREHG